jgi:hypothetical protein
MATAASDGFTKWLLTEGGLSRSEMLLTRFLPGLPVVGAVAYFQEGGVGLARYHVAIPVAVVCGFLPLWLLCTGLGKSALSRYAVWEFLIPAIAFFGTLRWHPENRTAWLVVGALLMLMSLVLNEIDLWWVLRGARNRAHFLEFVWRPATAKTAAKR